MAYVRGHHRQGRCETDRPQLTPWRSPREHPPNAGQAGASNKPGVALYLSTGLIQPAVALFIGEYDAPDVVGQATLETTLGFLKKREAPSAGHLTLLAQVPMGCREERHSAAMDAEIVALVTAGVGLVGALGGAVIGGAAAMCGARIGAETTARATEKQVREQALNEHEHWLREQRLQAYRALLVAFDEFAVATTQMSRMLNWPSTDADPIPVDIGAPANAVTSANVLIQMLGPEGVRAPAAELWERVYEAFHCLSRWRRAFIREDDDSAEQARAEWERVRKMGAVHIAFVQAATEAVANPEVVLGGVPPASEA